MAVADRPLAITMISLGVWAPAPGVRSKQVV